MGPHTLPSLYLRRYYSSALWNQQHVHRLCCLSTLNTDDSKDHGLKRTNHGQLLDGCFLLQLILVDLMSGHSNKI